MNQYVSTAVMARRSTAPDSLDFFPTPPWATRALLVDVFGKYVDHEPQSCWEPAAGEGHMAEVLREFLPLVHASDVHDYGKGYPVGSFVGGALDLDRATCPFAPEWVITNPPFNLAAEFVDQALEVATVGVAFLLRTTWLESEDRWQSVFRLRAPRLVAQFVERCPMVQGRWDPRKRSATAYAWFIWDVARPDREESRVVWIPPGRRSVHTRPADIARYAAGDTGAIA